MSAAPDFGGPVSAALEADLRNAVVRQRLIAWLDLDNRYGSFVDRLITARSAGQLSYDVLAFRGSHLELMLQLESLTGGTEKPPLVLHLPGFTEETIRETPLLELYAAGMRYRKALDTLVTEAAAGGVLPDAIAAFIKARPDLTLESADAWLAARLASDDEGIAAQLRVMRPAAIVEDLLTGGFVASSVTTASNREALLDRFAVATGLPASWRELTLLSSQPTPGDLAFTLASWSLCVEYVHDLTRRPISPLLTGASSLPTVVIEACREIATSLRARHADAYQRTAEETERWLADEIEVVKPEDLGKIDTFRFEEGKVLQGALSALGRGEWDVAAEWARLRVEDGKGAPSFWLRADPLRRSAWLIVLDAAELGQAIARAGGRLPPDCNLEEAVSAYVARGAAVDQAHRRLEQRRVAHLVSSMPEFETLRAVVDQMRRSWRAWADSWARDMNAVCRTRGFLPPANLQQRQIFDDVVRPFTQEAGTTAYFVVDALRYEMAEELRRHVEGTPATTTQMRARLAELPSVTEVGMNVLAPVVTNGRLTPALDASGTNGAPTCIVGFSTGEYRVKDPETRRRAMHDRVGGSTCPWLSLEAVVRGDAATLKRTIAQAKLVVVHSQEIDSAGEAGHGPAVFEPVLQDLRSAWHLLREAGVRRFVVTSDHGFLLLDDAHATAQAHGRKIDPTRRHVFSSVAADHPGEVRVALADLGYTDAPGHLMFPESTAVFDTGRRPVGFVHGGNSLQERVIPVLTVVHRAAAGGSAASYVIRAEARQPVADMHCIEVWLESAGQHALDFANPREIELAMRVKDVARARVELVQARGRARLEGASILAPIGERFEIFFRLTGAVEAKALVELHHPGATATVTPFAPDARFAISALAADLALPSAGPPPDPAAGMEWLAAFAEAGVRQVFQHLATHGSVTESEAASMLGGPRGMRRFAVQFEEHVSKVPFHVRIDVLAGVKRYVRSGGRS